VSVLASYICILGYLLERLPSRANLLILLFLFLEVLLLYFLPLLGLLGALKCLPPIALTMLWLRLLLPKSASIPLTPITERVQATIIYSKVDIIKLRI